MGNRRYPPFAQHAFILRLLLLGVAGTCVAASGWAQGGALRDSILFRGRAWAQSLAHADMEGRGYQNNGHKKAAAFIAEEFEAFGLQPVPKLARNDVPWYQVFRMSTNLVEGPVSLSLNGQPLKVGEDFIMNPVSSRDDLQDLKVRDLGYGMPEDFNKSLKNTIVIIRAGLPPKIEQDTELKKAKQKFASEELKISFAAKMQAAGVIFVKKKLTAGFSPVPVDIPVFDLLADRLPKKKVKTASMQVNTGLKSFETQNVLGMVEGKRFRDSVIVVCAHYDHLGRQGDAIFYGGNDNASGTSMLLSLAEHYAMPANRPDYTMLFIAFSGEEAGLLGSTHFAAKDPLVPLSNIAFLLNIDLMANGADGITAVAGSDFPAHLELLRQTNARLGAVPEVKARSNAPNSDHYPFITRGVKGLFIYTLGGPPHYHDVNDTYENMEFQRYAEVRELLKDFLNAVMGIPK